MHPIVPLVNVLGAASLGVATGGMWFRVVVLQGGLTVLGGMADIRPVGLAVVLDLAPSWLVAIRWVVGAGHWANDCVADIA